ncbi:MAG TPA: PaaI family thioesterase [Burkholderiaceae bacterium]
MIDLDSVRSFFARAPFMVDLGVVPTAVSEGRCETELVLQQRHLQHTGQAHAGVVTAMADHTAGAAAQSVIKDGGVAITAELKTSLLRPAVGSRLVCVGNVIKAGRTLIFAESDVFAILGEQRTLVAKLSATLAVVQPT